MLGVDPEPLGVRADVLLGRLEAPTVALRK